MGSVERCQQSPLQKIATLRRAMFPQFRFCWRSSQFLPYNATFAQLLLKCSLDGRDRAVLTSNEPVILVPGSRH